MPEDSAPQAGPTTPQAMVRSHLLWGNASRSLKVTHIHDAQSLPMLYQVDRGHIVEAFAFATPDGTFDCTQGAGG